MPWLERNWFGGGYDGAGPLAGIINGAMAIASGNCAEIVLVIFAHYPCSSTRSTTSKLQALDEIKTQGRDSSLPGSVVHPIQ